MMELHRLLVIALCFAALPCRAASGVHVPAADLVEAARAALLAKASDAGVRVDLEVAGRVEGFDFPMATAVAPDVAVARWDGPWLRSRVGVPVQVRVGDRQTTATVWFAVTAPSSGELYADGFRRGESAERLVYRTGPVDLARQEGLRTANPASLTGMRLRRTVRAGDPVLASDFEPTPLISARQTVRVLATRGAVRLSVPAQALADGDAGQTIPVLPTSATSPIRARVVSSEVVTLEN